MSFETKLRTLFLCALLLAAALPRAEALDGPYLPQTIQGGPIIDASIFGNRELYPGQTTPIQEVIQNSGVLQQVVGYDTPSPYPISITLTVPLTLSAAPGPQPSRWAPMITSSSGNVEPRIVASVL
jgi:hypothetical protein